MKSDKQQAHYKVILNVIETWFGQTKLYDIRIGINDVKLSSNCQKYILILKYISNNLKKYVVRLKQIIPKHAESFTRIMKNNSLVLGKQSSGTSTREVEESRAFLA